MISWIKNIRWRRVFLSILWLGCLSGLIFLMSFISIKSNSLVCNDLRVLIPGEQSFVIREDIDQLLMKKHGEIVGRTLTSLPIHEIEQDLQAIPFIEQAMVNVDMNGMMTVNIKQRIAALRVINAQGEDFYIDENAVKFPLSKHYAPNVLVANGHIEERFGANTDSVQTALLMELFETAEFIQSDSLWNDQIEQLYVNANREIEMVPRIGGQQIILGNADSLQTKFNKLLLFYKHIAPTVGWDVYKTVNLSFANQLVCTKKENLLNNSIN
ncbi:cell division protein FtsQ [Albibacterium bauzanense]|uniref:Cell division protein FtsQ n=2 Tax=Albibacterium bauzanense TaxID=653929 RepID=A0A4R1LXE7_9SPHI|nr:cell division protein FtsQ [Albibacterium bauzanense]